MRTTIKLLFLIFIFGCKNQPKSNPVLLTKNSKKQSTDTVFNNRLGKIKGYELFYDCIGCKPTITQEINIYATKNNSKIELATIPIADYYIDDVRLIRIKNKQFIYVHSTHTYGHSNGKLYFFDTKNIKLNQVSIKKSNYVIPDSLSIRKVFELSINKENKFTTDTFLRSKSNGIGYLINIRYNLIKVKENEYELVPVKTELVKPD